MLGQIRLLSTGGSEVEALLRQPKRLALLAYLAAPVPGAWHRRDMILAGFWPEQDAAHARTSLRNALYVIRQALGPDVLRTRGDEEISVNPEALHTDLAAVWTALRDGRIEEALTAYRGELLPGLYPSGSDGFLRWLDTERTRLKVALVNAGVRHFEELARARRTDEALAVARRIAEIQPDDETTVRRVMLLCESSGDVAGGLAAFEAYRARLAADFQAEPAAETLAIAARLRSPAPAPVARTRGVEGRMPGLPTHPIPATPPASGQVVAPAGGSRARVRPVATIAVVAAVVTLGGLMGWRKLHTSRPQAVGATAPVTLDEGLQVTPSIAPNGRLVAYATGSPHHLRIHVQRLGTTSLWALTGDTMSTELVPRWAPDSDQLLFLARAHAYVVPALGGEPRVVARGTPGDGMVRSASWSPEGDSIAVVRNDSLLVQPLEGSGSRLVGTGSQLHSCVWSPARTWIACVSGNWVAFEPGPLFGNDAPSAIVVFPARGGALRVFASAEHHARSPAWSHDGRSLWFVSNRDGTPGEVYAARITRDGTAASAPVRAGVAAEWIGLSRDRLVYAVPARRANIWAVAVPGERLVGLDAARRLTSGNQLIEVVNSAPGSEWIVYDSNVRGNADIYRVKTDGTGSERLTTDSRPEYAGSLSPDGGELAWQRFVAGERHVFVKRIESDSEVDLDSTGGDLGVPRWSPDGRYIAAWSHATEEGAVLAFRRDEDGAWKRTWRIQGAQLPVWSADGRSLAVIRYDGGISVISADSGALHPVYSRESGSDPIVSHVIWNIDQAAIWFIGSDARGYGGIWSLAPAGGRPRMRVSFDDGSGRTHGPSLASDGRSFFFTLEERTTNVRWAQLARR
jgi:Tol biopolymer transport system component/DNA-binding SARP family transcriptional activator